MDEAYFHQLRKNIEILVTEGKLAEAFEKCEELLQKYPNQKIFTELKEVIGEKLLDQNKEEIKAGLKEVGALDKKDDTTSALKKTKELLGLAPNNEKLKRLYVKLQTRYKESLNKAEQNFLEQKKEELKSLMENDNFPQLLKSLNSLENEYKGNRELQKLALDTKEEVIHKQITEKKELVNSNKFDDIRGFISNLKKISPESVSLKKLEQYTKRREMGEQIENVEEFIYTSAHSLQNLLKLKKYEEAISVATEILKNDPENGNIRKSLKEAQRGAFIQNKKLIIKKIKEYLPALTKRYKENKKDFVRV